MSAAGDRKQKKLEEKKQRRALKKAKKNALVLCHDGSQFWTTQKQFWQWVREAKIVKSSDGPLTGKFINDDEEKLVVLANTILNISCPNHLREAMAQRKFAQLR
jgi:hypothetical protein